MAGSGDRPIAGRGVRVIAPFGPRWRARRWVSGRSGWGHDRGGQFEERDFPAAVGGVGRLAARDVPRLLGIDDWLASFRASTQHVLAVDATSTRRRLAERFAAAGTSAPPLVHPRAGVGSECRLGMGAVVCAGLDISTNVTRGAHVHVNLGATVGHDSVLANYVSVNPAATVSGECTVGVGALLGAASIVLQGLTVAAGSTVGAGAGVVCDVPVGVIVKGVPAR